MLQNRLRTLFRSYPRQYWFLMIGMLINTTGMGMIWPFLTIYLRQTLNIPLSTVTALLTLDSLMSIVATFIAGPISDRFGRKGVMVLSLGMMGAVYVVMSAATQLWLFAVLMGLRGLFVPLYRIGADAMVADMIQDHQRADAYSLLRTVNNIGVAVGPSLGGFVAAASYTAAFIGASSCLLFFSLFVLFTMKETLAPDQRTGSKSGNRDLGYGHILRDKTFLLVILSLTMVGMGSSLVFVLIGVYGKENFAISESQIGFLMAVNAMMVIFFQVLVTRITKRFSPLPVLMVGALFYAVGIGAISLGSTAWQFAICMAVLTIGELIVSPTSTSLTANLAPLEMRGRYMSFYWLAWSISHGAGPLVGGLIYDRITPQAMWLGGALWCVLGALVFLLLTRHVRRSQADAPAAA